MLPIACGLHPLRVAALLLGIVALCQHVQAQVVVRERIELGTQQTTGAPASSLGGTHEVRHIATEDGVLSITYGVMQRSAVQYPPTGISLRVLVNGTQVVDDPVFGRTWARSELIRNCQGTPYTEHYYTTTDVLEVGAVVAGDTLDFLFVTDRGDYGDDPLEGSVQTRPDGRLDVDLYHYDTFCNQFADRLTVIADIEPCTGNGLNPLCGPVASIIRQDNSALPADSCLMVSRMRTNLNLPQLATFEGPPGSPPDPYTYRAEARGIESGYTVSFELEVTRGGTTTSYPYGALEGEVIEGGDTLVVYRMNQHVRLVSNGRPAVGADPNACDGSTSQACYDYEFQDDQTLLVRLGDTVRGVVLDEKENEIASTDSLTVGCSGVPDTHPQAILAADVRFRDHSGVSSNAEVSVERASEDWAQAAVRFRFEGRGASFVPERNVLFVDGEVTTAGVVELQAVDGCCFSPITVDVSFPVQVGDDAEDVARMIADSIDADPQFTARYVRHEPPQGDWGWLVVVNAGMGGHPISFGNLSAPAKIELFSPELHFPPVGAGQVVGAMEHHVIGLNFRDGGANTIHVFVLPDSSMGATTPGTSYRSAMAVPGAHNSVFIDERAVDGDDASLPFTFGHELGHVLGNRHDTTPPLPNWNLMYFEGPFGERERWGGRKRLNEAQATETRADSGPSSSNPILQQD